MNRTKNIKYLKRFLLFLLAAICSLLILLPIYFIIINSLKTVEESRMLNFSLPSEFQWGNYLHVIKAGSLIRAFGNSMLMAGGSVIICLITGSMASYALSRRKTKLNNILYLYFFLGLIAPVNYITTLLTLKFLHLQNTYVGIILEFGTRAFDTCSLTA